MKTNKNNKWFSIVLALWLALILSYTGIFLLDYMVPFSRNIVGIEHASKAYYESYGGIEDALYTLSQNPTGYTTWPVSVWNYEYAIAGQWQVIPAVGTGNSPFDTNWNRLSQNEPIQLRVGQNRLSSGGSDRIRLSIRVPNFDGAGDVLDNTPNDDILLWQLSSSNESISTRDGEFITESDINAGITSESLWNSGVSSHGEWVLVDGTDRTFEWFYNNNSSPCNNGLNECVLKISVINPLITNGGDTIPFIEYRIETDTLIPLRYAQLESDGSSQAYTKNIRVAFPQQTTSSAFDFTVFQ